jgi:hypothetical protein
MLHNSFKELFSLICEIKEFVLKLNNEELKNYKVVFYNQEFPTWRLDMLWEFIFDDIEYDTMKRVFENNKII